CGGGASSSYSSGCPTRKRPVSARPCDAPASSWLPTRTRNGTRLLGVSPTPLLAGSREEGRYRHRGDRQAEAERRCTVRPPAAVSDGDRRALHFGDRRAPAAVHAAHDRSV